jgi:hypothetical protein
MVDLAHLLDRPAARDRRAVVPVAEEANGLVSDLVVGAQQFGGLVIAIVGDAFLKRDEVGSKSSEPFNKGGAALRPSRVPGEEIEGEHAHSHRRTGSVQCTRRWRSSPSSTTAAARARTTIQAMLKAG